MRLVYLSMLLAVTGAFANDYGAGPVRKKLIQLGWDSPDAESFAAHWKLVEKSPFDGIRIQLKPRQAEGGREVSFRNLFTSTPWKREWFVRDIELLKKANGKKRSGSFLAIAAGPAVDWFDDAAWKEVVEHARIAAWIAREAGLRGLMFDPEVGNSQPAFAYIRQVNRDRYSFDEYSRKARERGREWMQAIASEYPDMVFFTLFLNSGAALGALGNDPREGLERGRNYTLYPAFLNGMLDVIPPGMTIVDGAEYSYPHSDEAQYLKHVNAIRNSALALVAPENHARYRSQVQAALAIYLDAYTGIPLDNVHSDVYNDPPLKEGERLVDRLQGALMSAQQISDQYVWVWGERYQWWPTESNRVLPFHWEAILPGITDALRRGMDPREAALARASREFEVTERKLAGSGRKPKNLLQNGSFPVSDKKVSLEGWQIAGAVEGDPAFGYRNRGAVRLVGGREARLSQAVPVSHRFYRVRSRVRQMGSGKPVVRISWLEETGKPVGEDSELWAKHSPNDAWQSIEQTVMAPREARQLVVELFAEEQTGEGDIVWFDDVEVIPIAVN